MKRDKGKSGIDRKRRSILAGMAAAPAAAALSSCGSDTSGAAALAGTLAGLPANPDDSGIDHIIVVMMENRSFDHMLGWLPGADGKQAGLSYKDASGASHDTYPLAPEFQGCGNQDPDHSLEGGATQFTNGACDGFLKTSPDDIFPIGYYTQADLAFTGQAAPAWTVFEPPLPPVP